MTLNILLTPEGQLGLVALFIIALVFAARLMNKNAKARRRRKKSKR